MLNLGIPAGYSPAKGVDYWTEAEQQQMRELLQAALEEGLAEAAADLAQIGPEFAQSTAECADTGKVYVLPDGYLYAYIREALQVKEGWAIIVGTHVPLNGEYDAYYGGEEGDGAILRGLLEAYNDRVGYAVGTAGTMGVDAVYV